MTKSHLKSKHKTKNFVMILVLFSFSITFFISPRIADPINSPKMWLLMLVSAWLLPYLALQIVSQSKTDSKESWFYLILCGIFLFTLLLSGFFSDVKYRAFFGETQRKNGFVTYLGLIILSLSASYLIQIQKITKIYLSIASGTLLLALYGFIQYFNLDFIAWTNPYSPVIGTLGNPNFMAALLAVLGIFCFSGVFINENNKFVKIILITISALCLVVITFSKARQGLLSFGLGLIVFFCFLFYYKNKLLGLFTSGFALVLLTFSALGILQLGPLSKFLYKDSVSLRGYYWRTGLNMLKENPVFGVGLDSYGSYFNEYRDVSYPLNYGFSVTSNNAHNVPIQLFATSGFLTGIAYLCIIGFTTYLGISKIRRATGDTRILFIGLTAAYIAFQSQSIVSIDNIGLSVWGWLFGGLIVGISSFKHLEIRSEISTRQQTFTKAKNRDLYVGSLSWLSLIIAISLVAVLYQGEKKAGEIAMLFNSPDSTIDMRSIDLARSYVDTSLMDPFYKLSIAINLGRAGKYDDAIKIVSNLLNIEPRNLNYLEARASFYEFSSQYDKAIVDRTIIAKYNPWGAPNYRQLILNYIKLNNLEKAKEVMKIIDSFASETDIAKQTAQDLKNVS